MQQPLVAINLVVLMGGEKFLRRSMGGKDGGDNAGFFCTAAVLAAGRKPGFELVVLRHQTRVRARGVPKVQKNSNSDPVATTCNAMSISVRGDSSMHSSGARSVSALMA